MSLKKSVKWIIPVEFRPVVKRVVLRLWYFGNRYYCPVCRSNVRLWKPLGYDLPVISEKQIIGSGLRNAMCPVCGSSDRVRLLYLFIKQKTNLFGGKIKLLHVAPEDPLRDIFVEIPGLNYLTADIDPGKVRERMDITQIGYTDNTFDVIFCNHVLEHIPDDRKAISELFRVLKPAGWAILQVPISKSQEKTHEDFSITSTQEREKHFGQKDHVRIYGKDYTHRLKEAGFMVEAYHWTKDNSFRNEMNRYGLNPDEAVYYCIKTGPASVSP